MYSLLAREFMNNALYAQADCFSKLSSLATAQQRDVAHACAQLSYCIHAAFNSQQAPRTIDRIKRLGARRRSGQAAIGTHCRDAALAMQYCLNTQVCRSYLIMHYWSAPQRWSTQTVIPE